MQPSRAVIALASKNSVGSEIAARKIPNQRATWGSIRPAGSGRFRVRAINRSTSRSMKQFSALAPPTSPATANKLAICRAGERPLGDSHMPPAVVTKTRLESLGLVRERKSDAVAETERARAFIPPLVTRRPGGRLAGLKIDEAATDGRSSRARRDWQAAPRREKSGGSSSQLARGEDHRDPQANL